MREEIFGVFYLLFFKDMFFFCYWFLLFLFWLCFNDLSKINYFFYLVFVLLGDIDVKVKCVMCLIVSYKKI